MKKVRGIGVKIKEEVGRPLKAFTLIELIVTMIIMGVSSWLGYTVFLNVNAYYRSLNTRIERQIDIRSFKSALELDLFNADSLTSKGDSLMIFMDTSMVAYFGTGQGIVRTSLKQHHLLRVPLKGLTVDDESMFVRSDFVNDTLSFKTVIPAWVTITNTKQNGKSQALESTR